MLVFVLETTMGTRPCNTWGYKKLVNGTVDPEGEQGITFLSCTSLVPAAAVTRSCSILLKPSADECLCASI